jgi:DegV family protein with EDD domain
MGGRVRVLTDSVADLPRSLVDQFQIKVVPVYLVVDGQTYRDDGMLDRDRFYQQLSSVATPPTTAAPAPREFYEAYADLVADGAETIVALVTSSTVSSIYDHAQVAASSFDAVPVHVVDTRQISMGLGWLVIEAAERLEAGEPVQDVLNQVSAIRSRTRVLGLIDALAYLRRSGRVGWVSGAFAELLRIKPLISFYQGKANLLGRVRTSARGMRALMAQIEATGPVDRLSLLHARADIGTLGQAQDQLAALFPDLDIPVIDIGAVFATHVGPRCVGVALIAGANP